MILGLVLTARPALALPADPCLPTLQCMRNSLSYQAWGPSNPRHARGAVLVHLPDSPATQ
jgi:hypothetical protein